MLSENVHFGGIHAEDTRRVPALARVRLPGQNKPHEHLESVAHFKVILRRDLDEARIAQLPGQCLPLRLRHCALRCEVGLVTNDNDRDLDR